jgi:hypothetical protein
MKRGGKPAMMMLQMLYKSVLGLLLGINVGAIFGGILGATIAGPQWVVGGMILGAMAGAFLGSAAGFLKSINLPERVAQRQPARDAQPSWVHMPAGGD